MSTYIDLDKLNMGLDEVGLDEVNYTKLMIGLVSNLWLANFGVARIGAQNPNDMTEETGTLGYVAPKDSFGKKLMDRIRPTQPRFLHSTLRPPLPRCLNPTPVPAMLMQIHSDTIAKEEFENLCLILGIELDAVTTEKAIIREKKAYRRRRS
ncbi:unnamed protein product [Brassica oleracea]|uniref:(rape) hypothetical protein n=1 Tax=Brassica napus TaxID=3708 RepID=A0A816U2U5_BRANA|nr:unnamed protein product [Brassica napus]